jgi:hypothetical protein
MNKKYKNLVISIVLDIFGLIPIPLLDLFWAPISGYIMTRMYKGTTGKVAGIISFLEEILPLDIIPTFTIMWVYTYLIQKQNVNKKNDEESATIIDV